MKLGLKPAKHDPRTLRLARYLTPALPSVPPAADWGAKVPNWLMYGNDQLGDCAMATVAEMIRTWTANDGVMQTPAEQAVIDTYLHMSPNDEGLVWLDVLNAWRREGLLGHRIAGFAKVDLRDHAQVCAAIYLFGGLLLGVSLPTAVGPDYGFPDWRAPSRFHRRGLWSPGSWGGHAVPAVSYDSHALQVVTWGGTKPMDWPFLDEYGMEGYVAISIDWLGPDSKAPNGFDSVALANDLGHFQPVR